jgi:hypothetical protein
LVAFSADLVTGQKAMRGTAGIECLNGLTLATRLVSLLKGFDDTDSDGLPHVTDGETTKWGVLVVRFNTG